MMNPANVCLILGAGASKPYGFPLGSELKRQIIKYCTSRPRDCANDRPEEPNLQSTWRYLEKFAFKFDADRQSETIDQFLQTLSTEGEGKELVEHGKMALARVLGSEERPDLRKEDWYEQAFHLTHSLGLAGKKLRVITFNYERSFEYYCALAQQERHIEITHVYGQLLLLPDWNDIYGEYKDAPQIKYGGIKGWLAWKAREPIFTVKLVTPPQSRIDRCKSWIAEADYIIVLGFGFDHTNLNLIGFDNLPAGKFVFSSGFKLPADARSRVRWTCLPAKIHFGGEDADVATFLLRSQLLSSVTQGEPVTDSYGRLGPGAL